jgi:uncharacterized membrane protein YsdA (DUF1294 family)/cold shock CspA family protein
VINFDQKKGYGFIRVSGFDRDFFVHISDIDNQKILSRGQEVKFNQRNSERGVTAINVVPGKKQLSPYRLYGLISFGLVALIAIIFIKLNINIIISYLIAINVTTFLFYGYDKYISKRTLLRVPELVLQGLSFLGGSIGSFGGRKFFRHKTIKPSFLNRCKAIVTFQIMGLISVGLYMIL